MMEKATKEIITREFIEKELRFYNKADIRSSLFLCGVFSLFFIPITLILIFGFLSSIENIFLNVIFCAFFGFMTLSPVLVSLYRLYTSLVETKLLKQGAFDVLTYEVSYKSEEYSRRRCIELLHFIGFEKAVAVEHTIFQLTSAGDTFYLVTYRTKKPSLKLLYSTKMYEYKE